MTRALDLPVTIRDAAVAVLDELTLDAETAPTRPRLRHALVDHGRRVGRRRPTIRVGLHPDEARLLLRVLGVIRRRRTLPPGVRWSAEALEARLILGG